MLCYQEFFYNEHGFDSNFDPEFEEERSWQSEGKIDHEKCLSASHAWSNPPGMSRQPIFRPAAFPSTGVTRISVIHDGVDTEAAKFRIPARIPLTLPDGTLLEHGQPIVTFVNRRLSLTAAATRSSGRSLNCSEQCPDARIMIVGETKGVSYGAVCPDGEWRDRFLAEIEGQYDPSRVHFTGKLPYSAFIPLLQLSACHVYLTYPFVMSWSLLEAMACGCAVVGSDTAPVREVIRDGQNGLLVDFFSPGDLAAAVAEMLNDREGAAAFGEAARRTVERTYDLNACVSRQLALMDLVASRQHQSRRLKRQTEPLNQHRVS